MANPVISNIFNFFKGVKKLPGSKTVKYTPHGAGFNIKETRVLRNNKKVDTNYFRLRGDRLFRKGGDYQNRLSAKRLAAIPIIGTGVYYLGEDALSLFGLSDPNKGQKLKDLDKSDKSANQKINADGAPVQPLYQDAWNWMKANPGWAAGIGAGAIGIPLVAWLMARNKDQDQYQQEQEDKNSYKYKYGRR